MKFSSCIEKPCPFSLLGLAPTAPPLTVKARWHYLAKLHHPDTGGVTEDFLSLRQAYSDAYAAALLTPCSVCGGTGERASCGGFQTLKLSCPVCDGSGRKY